MSNLSKKSLFLILVLVAVLALGAALALSLATDRLDPNGALGPVDQASAAITPATSFGSFANGKVWYYTSGPGGATNSYTVNTSTAKGSGTNPYVISTIQQWVFFTNVITANNSTYNKAGNHFVLDADLNFGGNTIQPVGVSTTGFLGHFCGQKHTISNATVAMVTSPDNSSIRAAGLFFKLSAGTHMHDINIDSSVKYSYAPNAYMSVGGLAAYATNAFFYGISSYANITVNDAAVTTGSVGYAIGGLLGTELATATTSYSRFYSCYYKGTITATAFTYPSGATWTVADNNCRSGGLAGYDGVSLDVQGCSIDLKAVLTGGGLNYGGLAGGYIAGTTNGTNFKDIVKNTAVKINVTVSGNTASPDGSALFIRVMSADTPTELTNVYVSHPSLILVAGASNKKYTNVVGSGSESGVTVNADPIAAAAGNANMNNYLNVNSDGSLVPKGIGGTYTISYDIGGGSWSQASAAPKSYKAAFGQVINISQLSTKPTKAGFTFSKWSFDKSGSSTVTNSNTLPATMSGNKTIYAIWTLDGIGNPTSSAVTYGASSVSMSAATHAAVTNNLASISYQWRKGSANGTVLA